MFIFFSLAKTKKNRTLNRQRSCSKQVSKIKTTGQMHGVASRARGRSNFLEITKSVSDAPSSYYDAYNKFFSIFLHFKSEFL